MNADRLASAVRQAIDPEGTITTGDPKGRVMDRRGDFDEAHRVASRLAERGISSSICRDIYASSQGLEFGSFAIVVQEGQADRRRQPVANGSSESLASSSLAPSAGGGS